MGIGAQHNVLLSQGQTGAEVARVFGVTEATLFAKFSIDGAWRSFVTTSSAECLLRGHQIPTQIEIANFTFGSI
jgi:hypothetical protein